MLKKKQLATVHNKRRHGLHQKKTKPFTKVYWPYIPLLLIVLTGLILSSAWRPDKYGVLAYATGVSTVGLLDGTNQQRQKDGKTVLTLNNKLNQAAQAKANDMATRNYWSHNTPEGNEPWIFIEQQGYAYNQAGENLAYGFAASDDVNTGWMNSPSHKTNMLEAAYHEVGFGFANNDNYQSSGPQTVVVAMYGKPQVAAALSATPTPTPPQAPAPNVPISPAPLAVAAPPPVNTSVESTTPGKPVDNGEAPVTTLQTPLVEPPEKNIARVQTLTEGKAPWSLLVIGLASGASITFLLLKHGLRLRRMLIHGEQYILHHALLDITIVALVVLLKILSQTAGVIR